MARGSLHRILTTCSDVFDSIAIGVPRVVVLIAAVHSLTHREFVWPDGHITPSSVYPIAVQQWLLPPLRSQHLVVDLELVMPVEE